MIDTPTPEKREEIRRRAEAATPGPWEQEGPRVYFGIEGGISLHAAPNPINNSHFIAHAREDIPALLSALDAAIERAEKAEALVRLLEDDETVTIITALRARVAELEGALRWVSDWINYELPVPTRNATTALGVVLDTLAGRDNAALKEKNDGQG